MRRLTLRKETIAELTTTSLRSVVGGGQLSYSCPPTFEGCTETLDVYCVTQPIAVGPGSC